MGVTEIENRRHPAVIVTAVKIGLLIAAVLLTPSASAAVSGPQAIAIAKRECADLLVRATQVLPKGFEWRAWRHGDRWYAILSNHPRHQWCGVLNVQIAVDSGKVLHPGVPGNMETCYGCTF